MRLNLLHLLDYVIQTYSMASVTQYTELKHDLDYMLYRSMIFFLFHRSRRDLTTLKVKVTVRVMPRSRQTWWSKNHKNACKTAIFHRNLTKFEIHFPLDLGYLRLKIFGLLDNNNGTL